MIGKFQIAASFAVIYVYAGELMPTVVRSEAMGISSFVAGIGLLIFPYINSLVYFLNKFFVLFGLYETNHLKNTFLNLFNLIICVIVRPYNTPLALHFNLPDI